MINKEYYKKYIVILDISVSHINTHLLNGIPQKDKQNEEEKDEQNEEEKDEQTTLKSTDINTLKIFCEHHQNHNIKVILFSNTHNIMTEIIKNNNINETIIGQQSLLFYLGMRAYHHKMHGIELTIRIFTREKTFLNNNVCNTMKENNCKIKISTNLTAMTYTIETDAKNLNMQYDKKDSAKKENEEIKNKETANEEIKNKGSENEEIKNDISKQYSSTTSQISTEIFLKRKIFLYEKVQSHLNNKKEQMIDSLFKATLNLVTQDIGRASKMDLIQIKDKDNIAEEVCGHLIVSLINDKIMTSEAFTYII